MKKAVFALTILFLITSVTLLTAHGDEDHKKMKMGKPDTLTIVNGDTIAVNGHPKNSNMQMAAKLETKEEKFELKPLEMSLMHIHNKMVHFPIAIGVFAFLFSLLHLKWKNYDRAILIMVAAGFLFSAVAYFTGNNQAQPFVGTGKEWVVNLHRYFGISVLSSYLVWLIFLLIAKIKKYAWIIGAILFLLVSVTGFLGGVIAH